MEEPKNKSVLVTGVAGFIGSNVIVHLVNKYPHYHFVGVDKLFYCSNRKNFEEIQTAANFTFIKANIGK